MIRSELQQTLRRGHGTVRDRGSRLAAARLSGRGKRTGEAGRARPFLDRVLLERFSELCFAHICRSSAADPVLKFSVVCGDVQGVRSS